LYIIFSEITQGNVVFSNNHRLCFEGTINWRDILSPGFKSSSDTKSCKWTTRVICAISLILYHTKFLIDAITLVVVDFYTVCYWYISGGQCHRSCKNKHCWGSGKDMCQKCKSSKFTSTDSLILFFSEIKYDKAV